jgi:hypothetical protein
MNRTRCWCGLSIGLALFGATSVLAEEQGKEQKRVLEPGKWYPMLEAGMTVTQSSYTRNWSGGDKGSIVWAAILNAGLESQVNSRANSNTTLKLSYGQTHRQVLAEGGDRGWDAPEKSTDLIDLESILRLTLGAFVDPYASARFESQFQDLSDPLGRPLSFNPMKFKESAGIARKFIDREDRSLLSRLGFTFRQSARKTFLSDSIDAAGRPVSERTRTRTANDGGIELACDYRAKVLDDRVSWTSKLIFYQPVFYSGDDGLRRLSAAQLAAADLPDDIEDYPKAMDLDWENIFSTQITKVLSVNLYTRWVYDKYDNSVMPVITPEGGLGNPDGLRTGIRRSGQFKQTLSPALTFRVV